MIELVDNYLADIENYTITNQSELEEFRLKYLSKKGLINELFEEFKTVQPEKKRDYGKKINDLKVNANTKYQSIKETLDSEEVTSNADLTITAEPVKIGTRHPISLVKNEIVSIFERLGFAVSDGPEIEDDWHVFSALNFPLEHPARDMQDTFFINKTPDILLRTHTSSVQVRVMEKTQPPIRLLMPGRVFRNEAISARSHCMFHQVEGLFIDKKVSFADLKQTLLFFAKEMFGPDTKIRLRPSFFHLLNLQQKWIFRATVEVKDAISVNIPAGSKFSAVAWWIRTFSIIAV